MVIKMLGEATTLLLGIILAVNASKDVFKFHTENMTWMEARAVCSSDGGSLANNYGQEGFIDLLTNVTDQVWIGKYYSPWVWLLGCYSYTTLHDYIEIKANQMKECLNHCHKTNYFGLQNKKCFCLDKLKGAPLQTSKNCKYECPGNSKERCGGENAITIYMNDICYENSALWQGTVSQTKSGKQCLPWAGIKKIEKRQIKHFPDGNAENASNYCRNPIGLSNRPFCFISETDFEDCDVPPCINISKAAEDGTYPCMSFKKPAHRKFQFTQEDCEKENFAICINDDQLSFDHNKGTWQNARSKSRRVTYISFSTKCESLAGPQIFRLTGEEDVVNSHWFGFFREVCTESETVPNKVPTKCFSLSKDEENSELEVEDCDNENHFICQYMAVTCGDTFNNTLNGSFETPGYTNSDGYGDFQRCIWTITVPENHNIILLLDISTEHTHKCISDILKVYEESYETGASFCGESTETYNTTGNHVTIQFKSDGTDNHFRGVQVNWSAVPILLPTSSTRKFAMTTEHPPITTTQATEMTTFQHLQALSDSKGNTLAGGTLVGIIVGVLIGLCLVLGVVLFWAMRRKASKNKDNNSIKTEVNMPAIRPDRRNSGNSKISAEIYLNAGTEYLNAGTESEHVDYSLPYNDVNVRKNAGVINSVSVGYRKKNGKDGCDLQCGGNSDVYNTLHETTEDLCQNDTENVYNRSDVYNTLHVTTENLRQNDTENVYNRSDVYNTLHETTENLCQNDTENVYNHFNYSEETYDHTTSLTGPSKAGAKVDHLVDVNESTYDVTSM